MRIKRRLDRMEQRERDDAALSEIKNLARIMHLESSLAAAGLM